MTEFQSKFKEEIIKLLMRVGFRIEREAKERCPVVTGRLRSSITTQRDGDTIVVGSNVFYAPYVEFLYDLPPKKMWPAKAKRGGQPQTTLPFFRPAMYNVKKYLELECKKKK